MGLLPQSTATNADGGPEFGTSQSCAASPVLVHSLLLAGLSLEGKGRVNTELMLFVTVPPGALAGDDPWVGQGAAGMLHISSFLFS